jgi:hypothetical protein
MNAAIVTISLFLKIFPTCHEYPAMATSMRPSDWPAPNYVDPETRGYPVLFTITCTTTAVVVILRLYSRLHLTKSLGVDDWLLLAGFVSDPFCYLPRSLLTFSDYINWHDFRRVESSHDLGLGSASLGCAYRSTQICPTLRLAHRNLLPAQQCMRQNINLARLSQDIVKEPQQMVYPNDLGCDCLHRGLHCGFGFGTHFHLPAFRVILGVL